MLAPLQPGEIHTAISEKYTLQDLGKSKSAASVRKRLRIEKPQLAGEICFLARVRVRPQ